MKKKFDKIEMIKIIGKNYCKKSCIVGLENCLGDACPMHEILTICDEEMPVIGDLWFDAFIEEINLINPKNNPHICPVCTSEILENGSCKCFEDVWGEEDDRGDEIVEDVNDNEQGDEDEQ
jgi:hypothetical protein